MSSEEFKPILTTPFFRKFTDERARDIHETRELYARVRARYFDSPLGKDGALQEFVRGIALAFDEFPPDSTLQLDFCMAIDGVCKMEDSIFGFPEVKLEHLSLKEQVELSRQLRAKDYFMEHEERIGPLFHKTIVLLFHHLAEQLPKTLGPSPFVIPLSYALPEPKKTITEIFQAFWTEELKTCGLFVNLCNQLYYNVCEASGIPNPHEPGNRTFIPAFKNPDPIPEVSFQYLKNTPFLDLFNVKLPLALSHEQLHSHVHILGGSGSGKTQTIQQLLLHFLTEEDRPSIIVVDSQGDLIDKLAHLDLPNYDPIIITPKNNPALNKFDVKRLGEYDEHDREQVTAGVIQTFDYLFQELFELEMTGKQQVFFRYVSRMLMGLPQVLERNATMLDMLDLLDDHTPYLKVIEKLPRLQKQFFERDFIGPTFKQTKEQIRYRLQAILENPTLERLFTCDKTKIDLFSELNNGSVILVDTNKAFLKSEASSIFGKLFIAIAYQSILERAVIPENKRKDAFIIVDEAAQYFSGGQMDEMLSEMRKYKCGMVAAHQFLEQATPPLKASLAANCSVKMASGISERDARSMAADMRCSPEFILQQPRLHFACHIRNVTPQAVSIPIKAGELEKQPRLSAEDYDLLIARNNERVSNSQPKSPQGDASIDTAQTPKDSPPSSPAATVDTGTAASKDW